MKKVINIILWSCKWNKNWSRNFSNSMSSKCIYLPSEEVKKNFHFSSFDQYKRFYDWSIENPDKFWLQMSANFYWHSAVKDPKNTFSYNFDVRKGNIYTKWMEGATTNICFNALDMKIKNGLGDNVAFYWEGNHPNDTSSITYSMLLKNTIQFANVLVANGVKKGDRVAVYLPMILELPIALLACARIGAVHSVIFAGFSSHSLAERIKNSEAKIVITADGFWRANKSIPLKKICHEAIQKSEQMGHKIEKCIVVAHSKRINPGVEGKKEEFQIAPWNSELDLWWHDEMEKIRNQSDHLEWVDSEHSLFMLYTSGSTGVPKGVLHTTGGYMTFVGTTYKFAFNYQKGDIYWCAGDIGWITGHSYGVYGPLLNGATSVMFEGTPVYPTISRYWEIIEKYKVTQFYTAPTVLRTLMKFGEDPVKKCRLETLKVLGTVGEPINKEAWLWYYKVIGNEKCPIVDTYWQTETGGHVILPLPGSAPMRPGSAAFPFFGIKPMILGSDGRIIDGEGEGSLVFDSIMRSVFNNHEKFENTYFRVYPGYYFTGDGVKRDKDGYLWITGRTDDAVNISGHLLSTALVESVLTECEGVAEAAVVARSHPTKGQSLYCFVTLKSNATFNDKLVNELINHVRERIGAFAQPDVIQYAPNLPKTRSGKIMRRILRKVAMNDRNVGDVSTLVDEKILEELYDNRPKSKL